jgi:hypothetical protein
MTQLHVCYERPTPEHGSISGFVQYLHSRSNSSPSRGSCRALKPCLCVMARTVRRFCCEGTNPHVRVRGGGVRAPPPSTSAPDVTSPRTPPPRRHIESWTVTGRFTPPNFQIPFMHHNPHRHHPCPRSRSAGDPNSRETLGGDAAEVRGESRGCGEVLLGCGEEEGGRTETGAGTRGMLTCTCRP